MDCTIKSRNDGNQRKADTIWTITANGKFVEQIDATTEHPFYVQGKGWVMARDLNPGDLIITAYNTAVVSRTVQSSHHDFVYNFTAANHNNYFVGKQQLWVHNVKAEKCGGGDGSSVIPKRAKPRIEDGNSREGWQHIDERHISGDSSRGPGDLFAPGTTRKQITEAAKDIVAKGTRVSDPSIRMQTFEKRVVINGKRDRVRVVVDSHDNNRVITMFPVRSE